MKIYIITNLMVFVTYNNNYYLLNISSQNLKHWTLQRRANILDEGVINYLFILIIYDIYT